MSTYNLHNVCKHCLPLVSDVNTVARVRGPPLVLIVTVTHTVVLYVMHTLMTCH